MGEGEQNRKNHCTITFSPKKQTRKSTYQTYWPHFFQPCYHYTRFIFGGAWRLAIWHLWVLSLIGWKAGSKLTEMIDFELSPLAVNHTILMCYCYRLTDHLHQSQTECHTTTLMMWGRTWFWWRVLGLFKKTWHHLFKSAFLLSVDMWLSLWQRKTQRRARLQM